MDQPDHTRRRLPLTPWEVDAVHYIDSFRDQLRLTPLSATERASLAALSLVEAAPGTGAAGAWRTIPDDDYEATYRADHPLSREPVHVRRLTAVRTSLPSIETPLSEDLLLELHRALQDPTVSATCVPGTLKTEDNDVTLFDIDGRSLHALEVCPAGWVRGELADAFEVYTEKRSAPDVHLLDAIAELEGRLLWIHPFADGNGRTARTLSVLLMLRGGYPFANWVGIEHHFHDVELTGDASWLAYRRYFLTRFVTMVAFLRERFRGDRWIA